MYIGNTCIYVRKCHIYIFMYMCDILTYRHSVYMSYLYICICTTYLHVTYLYEYGPHLDIYVGNICYMYVGNKHMYICM